MDNSIKFKDNSADILQKINLSLDIEDIEDFIKRETKTELQRIKQEEVNRKDFLKLSLENKK